MKIIKSQKPVLYARDEIKWASGAVFNPGVWYDEGKLHMLFRSVPNGYKPRKLDFHEPGEPEYGFSDDYISYIGYAVSQDFVNFEWNEEPFIRPDQIFNKYGAEDPRITKIDGEYLITYTALERPAFDRISGVRVALATTRNFRNIEHHSIVGPPNKRDKDTVIFPEKINGKFVMLHRIVPDIQIIEFDTLEELKNPPAAKWEKHLENLDCHVIMRPKFEWEAKKIGAGPTPIKTEAGWLIIYHGVDQNHVYRMGLALLDLNNPREVIARSPIPVMEPELDFEVNGDVPNVVFPEGAVVVDGILHIYYGAADLVVGYAYVPLSDLLEWLLQYNQTTIKK